MNQELKDFIEGIFMAAAIMLAIVTLTCWVEVWVNS